METGNASVRPFHFKRGQRVACSVHQTPWSIFSQLDGLSGHVEGESTTLPGYYHVRFITDIAGSSLWLIPWHYLLVACSHGIPLETQCPLCKELANVPG